MTVSPAAGGFAQKSRHSGARPKAANPESMNTGLWKMDSGFAAARRPGMTNCCAVKGLEGVVERAQIFERRGDAAGAVRDAGAVQAHLDPAQGAAQHQVVEMPEMADTED